MASEQNAFSRRALFRRGAALAGAASGMPRNDASGLDLTGAAPTLPPERTVPGFCELCFWNCGLQAEVRGNRVQRLVGHPDYPNARGRLCGRGQAGARLVTDEDRLRYPMLRTGPRGSGQFRRAGWPEALDTIAERLRAVREKYGPEAVALFYHGKGGPFFRRLLAAFGSPNWAAPSDAQCKGPRNVGYYLTFGEKLPSPEPLDLAHAGAIVLIGSHLGENAHNSQMQDLVAGLRAGARLITVDPRFSTAAAKSELWLPIRPGTDLALLLAWIHLLLRDGSYHREFVTHQCVGLERLAAHVRDFTPAWAAAATGLEAGQIESAYRIMSGAMPAVVIHPGRHTTWYGDDTQRARAMAILTALLGAWGAVGGIQRTAAPVLSDFPGPDYPASGPDVDKAAGRFPFALEVTTTGLRDATRTGKPYPVKAWFVYGTNLLQSLPAPAETEEAIRNLDLLAVCDVMPTELTRWADVLLPEDAYLERWDDLAAGSGVRPYVGLRVPAVTPTHDTRPGWRIARDLAQRLGLGDFFAFDDPRQYLEARLAGTGIALADLERDGIRFTGQAVDPLLDPKVPHPWKTPSGKVELVSKRLEKAGFDPMPVFRPHPEPPAGTYRLLYGRSPLHSFGRTQNNALLADLEGENVLWMNPVDVAAAGCAAGTRVLVESASGRSSGPISVRATERVPTGSVYMVHGFGSASTAMRRAYGRGASDTAVMDTYAVDPISGGTGMRGTFVRVRPAGSTGSEVRS